MIRRPPRSTQSRSSAASDVYKRQSFDRAGLLRPRPPMRPVLHVFHPLSSCRHNDRSVVVTARPLSVPTADRVTTDESSCKKPPYGLLRRTLDTGKHLYACSVEVRERSTAQSSCDNVLDLPLGEEPWERSAFVLRRVQHFARVHLAVFDGHKHYFLAMPEVLCHITVFHHDRDLHVSSVHLSFLAPVSYTHLRAHETRHDLVCRLLLE